MKLHLCWLSKLQELIFERSFLMLDIEVRFFTDSGVQLEEKLIIYKGQQWFFIIIKSKHGVYKGETELFGFEEIINSSLILASHIRLNSNGIVELNRIVLALP